MSLTNDCRNAQALDLSARSFFVKQNRRRHMATNTRMVRVCVCEDYAPGALELRAPRLC